MRIAFCLEYPIGLRGGVSVLVETLAAEMARCGHEIFLVSDDTAESLRESEIGKLIKKHFPWHTVKPTREQARQLANQLADAGVELAHFHLGGNYGWGNRLIGGCPIPHLARRGVACVTTSHSVVNLLNGYCGPQKPLWFKLLLLPAAWLGKMHQLFHVRAEIAASKHDHEKLCRWYFPLKRRILQIYHSRLHEPDLLGATSPRENVILNVGHLAPRKGQAILAEAFAEIAVQFPDWRLELIGKDMDGETTRRIQDLARQCQLEKRILFLGERTDVLSVMRRTAIYVQPSLEEALGLALQEAMAAGCATIGSSVGGIPELIENGKTGLLVESGNTQQLAAALQKLISNAAQREQFGRVAAKSIRERGMTVEAMTCRHLELYETVLRKS